jgi:hypothetical protein
MEKRERQFEEYLKAVSGNPATWGAPVPATLPQFLKQRYNLFDVIVGGRHFLGVCLADSGEFKPATFEKHLRQIWQTTSDFEGYCVIAQGLPSYVRQRMVERKIPFVDIGRQLFWPELGVAIQKKKTKSMLPTVEKISPATQAVLIHALNGGVRQPVTPKELAKQLGYTAMTMSRALDEIEGNQLCTIKREGRERLLLPEIKRVLWTRVQPFLKNPVRDVVRIKEKNLPHNLRLAADTTALAQRSMLNPPKEPVYALGRQDWNKLSSKVETIPVEDDGTCQVQLWRYDPRLFAQNQNGCVDPFSLYLSLRQNGDERIESALEEMMEKIKWL